MRTAHPTLPSSTRSVRRLLATGLTTALAATLLGAAVPTAAPSQAAPTIASTIAPASASAPAAPKPNPVTPGDFKGFGFDQCLAPNQAAMDAWLAHSPFLAVGIYISGDSRACRDQPHLTPTWIRTQLRKGWRLLPITLGPQASCQPRFPRYRDDFKISPDPGDDGLYRRARQMGRNSATETVTDAKALGIVAGSTLWYDLEGFDNSNRHCRESALAFLSGFTDRTRDLKYVPGVYSSVGSGILELDKARIAGRKDLHIPDRIWLARWDEKPNTSSSYISERGWRPGNRIKQYRGGHDERWGGVRINIDSNRLDLGRGAAGYPESHCGGVGVNFRTWEPLTRPSGDYRPAVGKVKALQCLLKEREAYTGRVHGRYDAGTVAAVRAWQKARGFTPADRWAVRDWMSLLAIGARPVLKFGVSGWYVRRLQRTLNAAATSDPIGITGVVNPATVKAIRRYQRAVGMTPNAIVTPAVWGKLRAGQR